MKQLTEHTLWVSMQLVFWTAVFSGLIYALGIGFALYLVPINLVVMVYVILNEVEKMIEESGANDAAV